MNLISVKMDMAGQYKGYKARQVINVIKYLKKILFTSIVQAPQATSEQTSVSNSAVKEFLPEDKLEQCKNVHGWPIQSKASNEC